ncbi:uncharacterized protein DS421_5g143050 [Arachis hypogaea]|nr:uncharacterized protein DS421_5g143050 [Arachis hypogaea]
MTSPIFKTLELRDFMFDISLISEFIERWRLETHMFHLPWGEVENLLGTKPLPQPERGKQVFGVRMTWLRDRVAHIPARAALDTLRQYAQCYLIMLIGKVLLMNKSATGNSSSSVVPHEDSMDNRW